MKNSFVKFDRKIKDWGWYTDTKTFKLFFHLVMFANFKDGYFLGVLIKRGQLAKSVEHLAAETGLTCSEVRTAIKHLESTGEITTKSQTKFTVFPVVKYNVYQSNDKPFSNDLANKSQAFNEHLANESQQYKNDKNEKNEKNDYIPPVVPQGDTTTHATKYSFGSLGNVMLTMDEYHRLSEDYPNKVDDAIEFLSNYIAEDEKRKKEYANKDHNLVMRRWVFDAVREREERKNKNGYQEIESSLDFNLDDIFEKS